MSRNRQFEPDNKLHTEVRNLMIEKHHGRKIKHYRIAKEVSLEQMAVYLDINVEYYAELEKQDIIDDNYLIQIAEILNIGIEWLKEIPIHTGLNYYYQEGNGNYYQNYGDTHHHLYKSVDEVVTVCEATMNKVEKMYERILKREEEAHQETKIVLKETQETLFRERKAMEELLYKLHKKNL